MKKRNNNNNKNNRYSSNAEYKNLSSILLIDFLESIWNNLFCILISVSFYRSSVCILLFSVSLFVCYLYVCVLVLLKIDNRKKMSNRIFFFVRCVSFRFFLLFVAIDSHNENTQFQQRNTLQNFIRMISKLISGRLFFLLSSKVLLSSSNSEHFRSKTELFLIPFFIYFGSGSKETVL